MLQYVAYCKHDTGPWPVVLALPGILRPFVPPFVAFVPVAWRRATLDENVGAVHQDTRQPVSTGRGLDRVVQLAVLHPCREPQTRQSLYTLIRDRGTDVPQRCIERAVHDLCRRGDLERTRLGKLSIFQCTAPGRARMLVEHCADAASLPRRGVRLALRHS